MVNIKVDVIERIATYTNIDKENLIRESLASFLRERRRAILMDKIEIISRYGINSAMELEKKIEKGIIPEHPAWEDLIEVENLEAKLEDVERDLQNLSKSG